MAGVLAFKPGRAATVSLSVSTVSDNVQVQTVQGQHLRLYNAGPVTVFVDGDSADTAAAAVGTGMPIPPGAVEIIAFRYLYLAAITAGGTATLYCTPGDGI